MSAETFALCMNLVAINVLPERTQTGLLSHSYIYLSRDATKPVFGVSDQVRHNRSVQRQKVARGLKFRIQEEEELYYLCSENKDADQLCSYCAVDLRLIFAYAKSRFSHDAAQFMN